MRDPHNSISIVKSYYTPLPSHLQLLEASSQRLELLNDNGLGTHPAWMSNCPAVIQVSRHMAFVRLCNSCKQTQALEGLGDLRLQTFSADKELVIFSSLS